MVEALLFNDEDDRPSFRMDVNIQKEHTLVSQENTTNIYILRQKLADGSFGTVSIYELVNQ